MRKINRVFVGAVLSAALLFAQEQKNWKDPAEYDLYSAAAKETDARKRIAGLDVWKAKYPSTDYAYERLVLYLKGYEELKDTQKLVATLNEMLAVNPKDLQVMRAIMVMILSPQFQDSGPQAWDNAEKVATAALSNVSGKPASATDAEWAVTRKSIEALSHTTLGWVAMNRKQNDIAEREFIASLRNEPNSAQLALWLGNVVRADKSPEKQSQALFYFARAAAYDGPGSLPPDARQKMDEFLKRLYNSYHGPDQAGLDQLKALARSQPLPPEGFLIKQAAQIAVEKQEELQKSNPQLALWLSLKSELTGANGQTYFDSSMKGAIVPGGAAGVQSFKGSVISAKANEIIVGIADSSTPEVTLKLDSPMTNKPAPGTQLEFSGMAESFAAEPFMVTFQVERGKVKGLQPTPQRPRKPRGAPR